MLGKLDQIQGMRALAILGIFICHTYVWLADDLEGLAPFQLGGSGVIVFFMISGFLLAYKKSVVPVLERNLIVKSAWKKVSKMYVLYILTFFVSFLAKLPTTGKDWLESLICVPFQLTMTQAFIPVYWITNSFNGPSWFLSALFGIWILIYLFPHGINKLITLSAKWSVVAIAILLSIQMVWLLLAQDVILPIFSKNHYLIWGYDWLVYSNPVLCYTEFLIGALIGRICVCRRLSVVSQNVMALTALCMLVGYIILLAMGIRIVVPWIVIVECITCVGFVAIISPEAIGCKIMSNRLLVWFGNISGCFFLIHGATNFAMRATIAEYIPKPWLFFVSLATSTLLALLADWYYTRKRRVTIPIDYENA